MALKAWQIILIALGALVGLFFLASIAIGAIVYFGVLSPISMMPDRCMLEPGLECLEHTVTPDEVILVLGNSLGREIIFQSIIVTETSGLQSCTFDSSTGTEGLPLAQGQIVTITSNACEPSRVKAGKQYRYNIKMVYRFKDSDLTRPLTGEISTTVK